jgi:hypothetical protein
MDNSEVHNGSIFRVEEPSNKEAHRRSRTRKTYLRCRAENELRGDE